MATTSDPLSFLKGDFGVWLGDTLSDVGSGIARGGFKHGFGEASRVQSERQPGRDAARKAQEDEAKRVAQLNETVAWMQEKAQTDPRFNDAIALAEAGVPLSDLYPIAMQWASGGSGGDPYTLSPGQSRFDGNNQLIASVPAGTPEAPKPPSSVQEYEYARGQGYQGTYADFEKEMRQAGATNIDFNANQGTAAAYADRMASADSILSDPKLVDAMTSVEQAVRGSVPMVGNFLTSAEKQQADQAQRDFINAILRRESGAVIAESEFQNARQQYFPQPGDTPEVIAQKAQNRQMAIAGVSRAAGPNYQPPSLGGGQPRRTSTGVTWSF